MSINPQETTDLFTFTKEILSEAMAMLTLGRADLV